MSTISYVSYGTRTREWKKTSIIVILFAVSCVLLSDEAHARNKISTDTILQVDTKLKLLNKPAVKSIKSPDGDIIDCVDIYKQPAFDHPLLSNHTIQKPKFRFASGEKETQRSKGNGTSSDEFPVLQTWQRSGKCPEGTIPIRRVRREDLLRAVSVERFGRKNPQPFFHNATSTNYTTTKSDDIVYVNNTKLTLASQPNRSVAILLTVGYNYIGAKGTINLWNPRVASRDEYSSAQVWLKNGPADAFESVEAGWTVNPTVYGDTLSRLFVHWTIDSYKSTGCFDLLCQGFVQTHPGVALGAVLQPWSRESGTQYDVKIAINMDESSNWWLKAGDGIVIGYWPAALFGYLKHSAILVHWGGEVYSPNVRRQPHTTTAMGSGEPARNLFGSACYIENVRIVDYSLAEKYPEWVGSWGDEDYCYSAYNYIKSYGVEPVFYFGGPGRNSLCP